MTARSLFDKVWDDHIVVAETPETPAVLYIDLHLAHEVTSPEAFNVLSARGIPVRRPDLTLATLDHSTPTVPVRTLADLERVSDPSAARQIRVMLDNCRERGIRMLDFDSDQRGIVHVIGPELGITQPGKTIVCGDSHTSTHGAFGALGFGIGTTEVSHVLATQCLLQRKPRTMAIDIEGQLSPGVTAKDIILAIIGRIGVGGATGHVIEYRGSTIRALSMEERMTVCNMSIEAGARAGMVAPDDTTFAYLDGRPLAPRGAAWQAAVRRWRALPSDPDARFDHSVSLDAADLAPMITFGTNPGMVVPIGAAVPADTGDASLRKALQYMGVEAGKPLLGRPVDVVFIGSCTNSRLSDLRQAASIFRGRQVPPGVRVLVVPGSQAIKKQAEAEGLDRVFRSAGAEWRESGCSMCIGMNGDTAAAGQLCVSTSNRNFEGRQGIGARTVLASPLTAAAAAVSGRITDPRELLRP
ncbi:MAG: 3-isopropylmalate dehydratase large subunit [Gammaproteobacteria bacterium]|nr:3-isopropylmalate dehydratase large subunit [Gammaproteobacteria bacterium]